MKFKESETVELKKSTSELKEAVISIASILNKHQKGELYFGIKNDGAVVGLDITERTLREISKAISDSIEQKIYPSVQKLDLEGKECVKVSFHGEDAPYFAFGRAYIRVSDDDRRLSPKEIENYILKKNMGKLRWDSQICENATLGDIDESAIRRFIEAAKKLDTLFG